MSRSGSRCIRPVRRLEQHVACSTPRRRPSNAFWLSTASLTTTLASRPANAGSRRAAQRPIQSRARKPPACRSERQRVLDVENRAHLAVDLLAVLDADAVLRRRRRPRPVDEDPHHVPDASRRLWMSQTVQAARCRPPARQSPESAPAAASTASKQKKWARAHLRTSEPTKVGTSPCPPPR